MCMWRIFDVAKLYSKEVKIMKKRIVLIISVALAALIALSVIATAAYDSTSDPIISLSYLTKYVEEALKPINDKIDALAGGESGDDGEGQNQGKNQSQSLLHNERPPLIWIRE